MIDGQFGSTWTSYVIGMGGGKSQVLHRYKYDLQKLKREGMT